MALNYSTNPTFAGRITAADANYPYGSSKDETSPGANDGMPHIKQRADDLFGFMQALLTQAGIVPSGSADTAVVSQYVDAIRAIVNAEDAATLQGQNGAYYRNLANATGTLPSSSITGDFAQSRITNLVNDLVSKISQATNISAGSGVGANAYFQLGNILVNVGSGSVSKGATASIVFNNAFTAVTTVNLTFTSAPQDFSPWVNNISNTGFDVTADASSGAVSTSFHYIAIGWKA